MLLPGQAVPSLAYGVHCAQNALFFSQPQPPVPPSGAEESTAPENPKAPSPLAGLGKNKEPPASPEAAVRAAALEAERRKVPTPPLLHSGALWSPPPVGSGWLGNPFEPRSRG